MKMLRKSLKNVCMGICLAAMLTACGEAVQEGNADSTGQNVALETATDISAQETDAEMAQTAEESLDDLLASCEYLTKDMYERATSFSGGDVSRIAAVMRKAMAGEKITVGVIGGSITQGSSATGQDKCYASLLKKWWEDTFPEAEIEFINAGVGGTSSYLGVHRVDEDLLSFEPDFVVVEFSVNDGNTMFYKKSYDNLVRRILLQDNMPAVMLLFMTMEDGTSAQENDSLIGFQYGLPMLSYKNAVLQEIQDGNFTWKDISPDNVHPNNMGHAIVGELFSVYLTDVYNRLDTIEAEVTPFDKPAVTKEVYMDATILNSEDIEPDKWGSYEVKDVNARFPGNWSTQTGEESIVFTVEAANIGIMYQKTIDGQSGQFEVYIDGAYAMTLDADFSGGWGNYSETAEVFVSGEKAEHTIEIKKKEGSTGDAFTIVGLMIS
ncbi:MAG: SGNH/GDSL hydrolase family protein [Lachnospiraceae bacterium]